MKGYLELIEKDRCVNFVTTRTDGTSRLSRTLILKAERGHWNVYRRAEEDRNILDYY